MSTSTAYHLGFRTVENEFADRRLPVEGTIPDWLSGRLVRNGPGRFEIGGDRVTHWFDGLAMLRGYAFDDGEVRYTNRFLRSDAWRNADRGRSAGEFATGSGPLRRAARWLRALGPPEPTDNANVNVARFGDRYVAQTEAPRWVTFDPRTLETCGEFRWRDGIPGHLTTAHTKRDPRTGETIGFGLEFGRRPRYRLYAAENGTAARRSIGSVRAAGPGYVHDCGLTRNHVVLVETPLRIAVSKAFSPWTEGLLDTLQYDDRDTRLLVVDRETGDLVADPTVDPFFVFHHANAFEAADGDLIVDLVTFEDATIVEALSLETLAEEGFDAAPEGRLERLRIDPARDAVTARTPRHDGGVELPTVPRSVRTRSYRYAYAQATDRRGANGLAKIDVECGTATEWWRRRVFVEEPRMVQRPGGDTEDDGVVLAPALDAAAERSVLLVFDAETLSLRARATLPHAVPFGFHGRFFRC